MPIPTPSSPLSLPSLFPDYPREHIDATRISSWYSTFRALTVPSVIVDLASLGEKDSFLHWLASDSIFLPENSEPSRRMTPASTSSSDDGDDEEAPVYRLPLLTKAIWDVLRKYGGDVFPKLNWTAPRDAAFILPQTSSGPLCCTSPADVYLLLKSSDLISHDLDPEAAYHPSPPPDDGVKIELVLRKYTSINPSTEFRCFVRRNMLLGVSQRDGNRYEHWQGIRARQRLVETVRSFWEDEIRGVYEGGDDYIFDIDLPSPSSPRIIDFNIYRPTTDPLLFTYPQLHAILIRSLQPPEEDKTRERLPILRVVEQERSGAGYEFAGNMMPLEMVQMSEGQTFTDFTRMWGEAMEEAMGDSEDE
ncbi:hypothetical protein M231_06465 [Tremella mesenterica]|uniref:Uncharacterized protein n=1 Tax=Tremella mesenterica TaxID=5217 RepID=A0A4Q1BBR9_TREME|nr:hypothetical protein M231_06465 [Tremella mesenterica]